MEFISKGININFVTKSIRIFEDGWNISLSPRVEDKPQSEISKQKLFMEIFSYISGQDKRDVYKNSLIKALIETGRFTELEALRFIEQAVAHGQIYERREGWYAKA